MSCHADAVTIPRRRFSLPFDAIAAIDYYRHAAASLLIATMPLLMMFQYADDYFAFRYAAAAAAGAKACSTQRKAAYADFLHASLMPLFFAAIKRYARMLCLRHADAALLDYFSSSAI